MKLSRRTLLQSSTAAFVLAGCGTGTSVSNGLDATAQSVLDAAKNLMLNAFPETPTSLGIDTGDYADLGGKLTDRSPAGQAKIAKDTAAVTARLNAIETEALSPDMALDVDVVRLCGAIGRRDRPYASGR